LDDSHARPDDRGLAQTEFNGRAIKPAGPFSLLVFADDWGRHPSSCQHLVRYLAGRHAVTWVNTIGTRRPQLNLATFRRGLEKVAQWVRRRATRPSDVPAGLRVLNPRMWPWCSSRFDRRLNQSLLVRQLRAHVRSAPGPVIAISTIPIVADLIEPLPVAGWVYYCVDDFGVWPGLDRRPLRRMEQKLIQRADVLVAVSEPLRQKLERAGRHAYLLTHGVDVDFWRSGAAALPSALERLESPLIVFWGVIDRRLDVAFLARLAGALDRGTIVLVGPQADAEPALATLPRVVLAPALALEALPVLAQRSAVLIMPYADLPVTRAMQPLKFKEYLATGRPSVVRDLPATRDWADAADLAASAEEFVRLVRLRLATGLPESQRLARGRLDGESWQAKARQFESWIAPLAARGDAITPPGSE
jgi:glycosyltransferase involved in cell wall biosynthesis